MKLLAILFPFFLPLSAFALAEGTGLKFSAAGDLVGNIGSKNQTTYPRRFDLREAEFGLYGPIDHNFDGTLTFAAHNEDGAYNLEVHEAYLSAKGLLPNLRLKAGKFFLGVGRLNQFHRHDWPFVAAPKSHRTYFDEEAAGDTGLQGDYLLSFLPIFTELTLGVTNGWTFGHAHNQGEKPIQPTHYARIANFFPLGETGGLQTGLNYLGRNARNGGQTKLFGTDLTAKWRENGVVNWLLQSELWGRNLRPVGGNLERTYGGYLYAQKNLFDRVDLGLRFDGYTLDTSPTRNLDYSLLTNVNFRHSEFALFKASYQLDYEKRAHQDSQVNRVLQIQAVFLLGDHPSHDF